MVLRAVAIYAPVVHGMGEVDFAVASLGVLLYSLSLVYILFYTEGS